MSDQMDPRAAECGAEARGAPALEALPKKTAHLGMLEIRRALPVRERRMIGPWCFLDRYGPLTFRDDKPMDVAPHPHIGLQTVTWLLDGEVLHRDSLGYESLVRPGQLNLMTSGRGISHSEETPRNHSGILNGVQLWVALPDEERNRRPGFEHHPDLPLVERNGVTVTTIVGGGSAAATFSPIIGIEIAMRPHSETQIALDASFEHAVMVLEGEGSVDNERLTFDTLFYLGTCREELRVSSGEGGRMLLIGGAPFNEKIFMWWNFVGRNAAEIAEARQQWSEHGRFGEVRGYKGPRIEAPPFPLHAPAPPAS